MKAKAYKLMDRWWVKYYADVIFEGVPLISRPYWARLIKINDKELSDGEEIEVKLHSLMEDSIDYEIALYL